VILVIDANVAIKWFVTESLHAEARRLLGGGDDLHAPDFLVVELANVAWKKAKRQEITRQQAEQISTACLEGVPVLHASSALVERATRIALDLDHPVYDCIYIACAEAVGGVLVTADEKMMRAAESTKFRRLIESIDPSARGSV
jgi:predicted nucleic acid-binding protein